MPSVQYLKYHSCIDKLCSVCSIQMTKEQLVRLYKIILTCINQTTLHILLPALDCILGVTGFDEDDTDLPRRGEILRCL